MYLRNVYTGETKLDSDWLSLAVSDFVSYINESSEEINHELIGDLLQIYLAEYFLKLKEIKEIDS